MSADRPVHQLVVTKIADDQDDDVEYAVTCPTPQPSDCRVWYSCTECETSGYTATEGEEDEGGYTAHGVAHQWINDAWMTETNDCALTVLDCELDGLAESLGLGTHAVDVDYWGDGVWDVTPALLEAYNHD